MLSINQGGYKGLQVIVGGIFIPIDQCALYKYEMNERATSTVVGTLPCFAAFTAKNLPKKVNSLKDIPDISSKDVNTLAAQETSDFKER